MRPWSRRSRTFYQQPYKSAGPYEFLQGGHLGYLEEPGGVFVNRKILYIRPSLCIIMDEMYTGDPHTYEQYWHFSDRGSLTLSEPVKVEPVRLPGLEEVGDPDPTLKRGKERVFTTEEIGTPPV